MLQASVCWCVYMYNYAFVYGAVEYLVNAVWVNFMVYYLLNHKNHGNFNHNHQHVAQLSLCQAMVFTWLVEARDRYQSVAQLSICGAMAFHSHV